MATKHIKKDDNVVVIRGAQRGKTGKVLQVVGKGERAIVEGVNVRKKHKKRDQDNPEGAILEIEMPIHVSNLLATDRDG